MGYSHHQTGLPHGEFLQNVFRLFRRACVDDENHTLPVNPEIPLVYLAREISVHRVMYFVRQDLGALGVMGVPMTWEIASIFVVGTGGSGFGAEAAPSAAIEFFMAVAWISCRVHRRERRLPASRFAHSPLSGKTSR